MSEKIDSFFMAMDIRLPAVWRRIKYGEGGGGCYSHTLDALTAIISGATELDGKDWIHLSVSYRGRVPTWQEFKRTKEYFLGDVYAYQVFPTVADYVNIHPNVLHLFHCLEGPQLPDFTRGSGSI